MWLARGGLSAPQDQEFGDLPQSRAAFAVRFERRDGFVRQVGGDLMRTRQTVERGVGGLLLRNIFSRRFYPARLKIPRHPKYRQ